MELQKYLEEIPLTLSSRENEDGTTTNKTLKDYLETLKSIVKMYKEEH